MFCSNMSVLQSFQPINDPAKALEVNSAGSGTQAWFSYLFCVFSLSTPLLPVHGAWSVEAY